MTVYNTLDILLFFEVPALWAFLHKTKFDPAHAKQ